MGIKTVHTCKCGISWECNVKGCLLSNLCWSCAEKKQEKVTAPPEQLPGAWYQVDEPVVVGKSIPRRVKRALSDAPKMVGLCRTCGVEPYICSVAPNYHSGSAMSGLAGIPIVGYHASGSDFALHFIVPLPEASSLFLRSLRDRAVFRCISCGHGSEAYPGSTGTASAVSPRVWMEWVIANVAPHSSLLKFSSTSDMPGDLSLLAAEFYTLTYIEELARELGEGELRTVVSERLESTATSIVEDYLLSYLYPACLAEARHLCRDSLCGQEAEDFPHVNHLSTALDDTGLTCLCPWFKKAAFTRSASGYTASRGDLHKVVPPKGVTKQDVLAYLVELFNSTPSWSSGYGGPLWATGAALGAEIGKTRARSLCDRAFNLAHNGGTLYNKNVGRVKSRTGQVLLAILETKSRARHFGHYAWFAPLATPETYSLFKRVATIALERRRCVLWDGEGRDETDK